MDKFDQLAAVAAPLLRDNIDTDIIIPSREMRSADPQVLAEGLFAGWRYLGFGSREADPAFVLNQAPFAGAGILLAGSNFGCGSSREHAVWALRGYGIRAVIAAGFSTIFFSNCVRNGLAPIVLRRPQLERLAVELADPSAGKRMVVDLQEQYVESPAGERFGFDMDPYARQMLLSGRDEIDVTLVEKEKIDAFLQRDRVLRPWVYDI